MSICSVSTRHHADHSRVEAWLHSAGGSERLAGFAQYLERDGVFVFFHTEVDEAFEGHGVGSQIARGVFSWARDEGKAVRPTCPFLSGWLAKHPEFSDVVAA